MLREEGQIDVGTTTVATTVVYGTAASIRNTVSVSPTGRTASTGVAQGQRTQDRELHAHRACNTLSGERNGSKSGSHA